LVAEGSSWKMLVVGQLCLVQGKGAATELVEALRLAGARHEHFAFVLVWLLDDIHAAIEAGMGDEEKRQSALSAHYVAAYLEQRGHEAERGFFDALLIAKLERVFTALNDAEGAAPIPRSLVTFAHETEVSLFGQRSAYQRLQQEVEARKSEFRRTHPNAMRADAAADRSQERATPTLNVRLFGGLEVRVGEVIVDPRLFSRQKVKVLLALLVINQGRELPRERLCKMLWPHSDLTASQRNLYSLWAMLKQALSSVTGSCPYLIHTQFSYKLDGHIASSDVAEFDSLCKKLLFSFPQADEWAQAFMQIDDLYIDDLLPTEVENPSIEQARTDYRNRLVDTLSAAAVRLLDAGEFQASLWFARAAILRDATREDSYLTLMRAQVALGQRAAALDTYFKCRHYLVEELGIDPSDRAVSLYSSIIAEEPGLRSYEPSTSKK
ncbi:MAG: hypothetical protein LBB46_04430, partial [Coriobacteriaceae bacterium]|nr:hypothetical protein [Coriobacteriaceae bacterium]